jgi:DNA modification methylase
MFHGSGTVGQCATDLARRFIGIELKAEYIAMHYLRRTTTGFPF